MTLNEYFVCPVCGAGNLSLHNAKHLMSDVKVDTLSCNSCGAEWRVYSKVSEIQAEIIRRPQPTVATPDVSTPEVPTPEENSNTASKE